MRRDLGGAVYLDGEEHYTTSRAAHELGISASTLRTMIQKGKVQVKLLNARSALIPKSEVERYKRDHRGHVGRRPKKTTQTGPAREEK
jgi:excisionase family DNA binding protein